jgi:hypothetical protein
MYKQRFEEASKDINAYKIENHRLQLESESMKVSMTEELQGMEAAASRERSELQSIYEEELWKLREQIEELSATNEFVKESFEKSLAELKEENSSVATHFGVLHAEQTGTADTSTQIASVSKHTSTG